VLAKNVTLLAFLNLLVACGSNAQFDRNQHAIDEQLAVANSLSTAAKQEPADELRTFHNRN
jgi:hypothetical protein